MAKRVPIRTVVERTGLSEHVIRAWERRYGAVEPARDARGVRGYTEREIRRLNLLRAAVERGHDIGSVATKSTKELVSLVGYDYTDRGVVDAFVDRARRLESERATRVLTSAVVSRPMGEFVDTIMLDVMRWARTTDERLAAEVARVAITDALARFAATMTTDDAHPPVLVASTAREWGEVGMRIVAIAAAANDLRPVMLGGHVTAEMLNAAHDLVAAALTIVVVGNAPRETFDPILGAVVADRVLVVGDAARASETVAEREWSAVSRYTDLVAALVGVRV